MIWRFQLLLYTVLIYSRVNDPIEIRIMKGFFLKIRFNDLYLLKNNENMSLPLVELSKLLNNALN